MDRRIEGLGCEEAIVEVGAFENGVDEEIEGMPDEQNAETRGG